MAIRPQSPSASMSRNMLTSATWISIWLRSCGLTQIGNEAEDLHFYGGRYGILTEKTSPAWQFTLIDSVFEGQREAAVREHEAGLTLIRDTFRNVPTAIDIDPGYYDQLWVKDSRFENISGAGGNQQPEKPSERDRL